ncbi:GNAT family N-acetyltransferase [Yangia mangrovi]|uniref:L-ornithine N(alpha)-acyltransferase n=1 Tax=Alloyangia mangrovi TaxID=1779329 RepID=A0A2A3K2U6_9RHOB|nr:GNAT family N-acyltransferase [Alloyangia mangrovi]MCT4369990.1 GNAT family N-acetyltransferase [Alloyangia mangrovi]
MALDDRNLTVRLARTVDEITAAQRLRYEVFVAELGGGGDLVDHENRLERDRFDPYFDHLLLTDARKQGAVVGVYRLLRDDQAEAAGQFYSEDEYDLAPLRASGRRLLELGRSCLHRDYRGGPGVMLMWQALSDYVAEHGIEILFGTASFHGTDVQRLAHPLSLLHARHLAPEDVRVRSRAFQPMDLLPEEEIDRRRAMVETPALIKGYLRLGGTVGEGAFVDHAFNTTDVCLVMDTQRLNEQAAARVRRGRG